MRRGDGRGSGVGESHSRKQQFRIEMGGSVAWTNARLRVRCSDIVCAGAGGTRTASRPCVRGRGGKSALLWPDCCWAAVQWVWQRLGCAASRSGHPSGIVVTASEAPVLSGQAYPATDKVENSSTKILAEAMRRRRIRLTERWPSKYNAKDATGARAGQVARSFEPRGRWEVPPVTHQTRGVE